MFFFVLFRRAVIDQTYLHFVKLLFVQTDPEKLFVFGIKFIEHCFRFVCRSVNKNKKNVAYLSDKRAKARFECLEM